MEKRGSVLGACVSVAQGIYYIVPGIWALLNMEGYQKAHRINSDYWMVKAHAMWLLLVGSVLAVAGCRRQASLEVRLLGFGTAAGLLLDDGASAATGRIPSRMYYGDMIGELAFVALWPLVWRIEKGNRLGDQ